MKWIKKVTDVAGVVMASLVTVATLGPVLLAANPVPAMAEAGPGNCMAVPASPELGKPIIEVSTGTTSGDRSPALAAQRSAAMTKIVVGGFRMQARLLLDTIGGGVAGSDLAVNTQLQPSGPNQLFAQQNQKCKQHGVAAAFSNVQRSQVSGSVDVLGALQVAQSNLTGLVGAKTPIDVVLMSNMINTSSPLNLAQPSVLAQDPGSLISQVKAAGLMPQCHSWSVYIIGGGVTASGGLGDVAYQRLKAFWTDFFAACGGQVVAYDNELTQFPVKPAHRPAVHVRKVVHQQQVVMTLPDDVLFASGSADLSPAAGGVLAQLLPVLQRQYPHGSIQVTGYTDNVPIDIPGGNTQLSIERGQAVADWLDQNGVVATRMHVLGFGSADPIASNATAAGQAQNRRVVVAVTK